MTYYSDEALERLLGETESDLVERKESFKGDAPNKAREAVCAFSNDLGNRREPGVIFVGARDDGSPAGLPITEELLRPLAALQQLVRNAVLHRSYEGTNAPVRVYWFEDRIEIISPGGPFGLVTQENFGQPGVVDYRSPILAEAMRVLGLVQRFGFGIPTARRLLKEQGHPEPELRADRNWVQWTVRKRPEGTR